MKRLSLMVLSLLFALSLTCCGRGATLTLSFGELSASAVEVQMFDGEGFSLGTAKCSQGGNVLPASAAACYLSVTLPKEYDCPVRNWDGSNLSMRIERAEQENGEYLHAFTVFVSGGEDRLQLCKMENGVAGYCKSELFQNGVAQIFITDGAYTLEIFKGSEIVKETTLNFAFETSLRFLVFNSEEGIA